MQPKGSVPAISKVLFCNNRRKKTGGELTNPVSSGKQPLKYRWLVGWSLTSLFSTNTAISETKGQGWRVILLPSEERLAIY